MGNARTLADTLMAPLRIGIDGVLERLDNALDRIRRRGARETVAAYVLLIPAIAVLGLFGFIPLFYAVYLSLFDNRRNVFVGARYYWNAFRDSEFWSSLGVTLYYAAGTIPLTMGLSFIIALGLYRMGRGRGLFRTVYFLPYVTSVVAAATVWRALLNPQMGIVNALLTRLGLPVQDWLLEPRGIFHLMTGGVLPVSAGPSLALTCIILFEVWHNSGFMIVVFLAGLSAIPKELEEAAMIDGASRWQSVRRITLPLLSPTIFFLVIVSSIKSFQAFNSFYALAGSESLSTDTQNLVIYIYAQLYVYHRYGYGAAIAVLLCLAIVLLTLIQWRYMGRRVHYE